MCKAKDILLYWVIQENFLSTGHLPYIQTTDGPCYTPLALP